jgi:hypothetical protein
MESFIPQQLSEYHEKGGQMMKDEVAPKSFGGSSQKSLHSKGIADIGSSHS